MEAARNVPMLDSGGNKKNGKKARVGQSGSALAQQFSPGAAPLLCPKGQVGKTNFGESARGPEGNAGISVSTKVKTGEFNFPTSGTILTARAGLGVEGWELGGEEKKVETGCRLSKNTNVRYERQTSITKQSILLPLQDNDSAQM